MNGTDLLRVCPVRHPGAAVTLPPRLFGSIGYYGIMAQYPVALINPAVRYDKNTKSVHRYDIVDTRGRLSLTVPVSRPSGAHRWCDVTVSAHGRWWDVQRTALESAYGRTPFFEFYIDRLLPLFAERPLSGPESITDLCIRADGIIRDILALPTAVAYDSRGLSPDFTQVDLRRDIDSHASDITGGCRYWQVRADSLGFTPGLSILDAIFNLGPEASLLLASLPAGGNNP